MPVQLSRGVEPAFDSKKRPGIDGQLEDNDW